MVQGNSESRHHHPIEVTESFAGSNRSEQLGKDSAPRLSILHLLVWTLLVAVVMAANTLGMRLYALVYPGGVREWMPTIAAPDQVVAQSIRAMISGAGLGGLLIYIARRRRGIPFPVEPGEWLLVMHGCGDLVQLCFVVTQPLLLRSVSQLQVVLAVQIIDGSVSVLKYLLPLFVGLSKGPWRNFFRVASVCAAIWLILTVWFVLTRTGLFAAMFMSRFSGVVMAGTLLLSAVLFVSAVFVDFRKRTPRGWVHWAGVITLSSSFVFQAAWVVYNTFIARR